MIGRDELRSILRRRRHAHDAARWHASITVERFHGDYASREDAIAAEGAPFDVTKRAGNLLLIGGVSALWEFALGNGTAGAGSLALLTNARARIVVGNGTAAAVNTQTALQGGTTTPKAMDATYPQHTDSTGTDGARTITFRSTYGAAEGNHAWDEWGVDNGTRLFNRKVEALGTKAGGTWVFTVTIAVA